MAIDRIVGRDEELRRMVDGLPTTPFEPGSTALISGSAGIGKTTLLRTFRALVMSGATHSFWIEGACSRQDKTSYGAFIDAFRRHLCRNPNTRTESVVEQVSAIVGGDAAMYLASLVDPHLAEWRIGMDPERLRHLTHDTIVEYLVRLSSSSPVVLVIEDIQWIDDVSMTLLKSLAFRCVDNALMIVATGRDAPEDGTLEFDEWCGWRVARRYIAVRLAELDFGLVRVLIQRLSNAPLPAMVEAQIMNRCGGNPLFISETMTAMEHRGDITFDEFTTAMPLPSKIEELITDRVAILPLDVRRCLSIAAVIGSFVRVDLLDALYGDSTVSLDSCLYELLRRDILMELDVYPVALFRFVHDAVQEAVYRSLSPSDRQRLHGRIGDVIDRAPTVSSEQIQMAAFHYAHSTNTEKATYYLMESAERERREFNLVRSYALLKQALSLTTSEEVGRRNILRRASILECAGDAAMHVGFHRDAAESFRDAANAFDMMAFRPTHGAWLRYRRADQGLGSQAGGAPLGWAYRKDSGGRCSSGKTSLSTRARESGLSRRVQTGRTAP